MTLIHVPAQPPVHWHVEEVKATDMLMGAVAECSCGLFCLVDMMDTSPYSSWDGKYWRPIKWHNFKARGIVKRYKREKKKFHDGDVFAFRTLKWVRENGRWIDKTYEDTELRTLGFNKDDSDVNLLLTYSAADYTYIDNYDYTTMTRGA